MLSINEIYHDTVKGYNQTRTKSFRAPNWKVIDPEAPTPATGFFLRFEYETPIGRIIHQYEYTQMVAMVRKILTHAKEQFHLHARVAGVKSGSWKGVPMCTDGFEVYVTAILNGAVETWEIPIEWLGYCADDTEKTTVIRYVLIRIRKFIERQTGRVE